MLILAIVSLPTGTLTVTNDPFLLTYRIIIYVIVCYINFIKSKQSTPKRNVRKSMFKTFLNFLKLLFVDFVLFCDNCILDFNANNLNLIFRYLNRKPDWNSDVKLWYGQGFFVTLRRNLRTDIFWKWLMDGFMLNVY